MTRAFALLLALLCAMSWSCAHLRPLPWQLAPPELQNRTLDLLEKDWLGLQGQHLLRLEGRLLLGSKKVQLTALLRRDGAKRTARVVLMGEMGVTLCDMDVTPSGFITHEAVPDLQKATRVQRHIARTLRRVFLLPLPPSQPGEMQLWQRGNTLMLRSIVREQRVERVYDSQSGLLQSLEAPENSWEIHFYDYDGPSVDGLPYPGRIEYRDASGGYIVQMLLLSMKPAS